ncbi:unnamed protein product, partial [Brugia timori]
MNVGGREDASVVFVRDFAFRAFNICAGRGFVCVKERLDVYAICTCYLFESTLEYDFCESIAQMSAIVMDDQYDQQMRDDDSIELKSDSDNSKKRRYATKRAFLVNDSHCSAPSSSPHSSPVDASVPTDFSSGELNDAIQTYSRCK